MRSILLVKTSSLGDVIHNFPAVTELRRHLPDARVDWVVEEAYAPLVGLHPGVNEVIPMAIRRWRKSWLAPATWHELSRLRDTLRQQRYDAIIDTQGLAKSALIARSARGTRHGFNRKNAREAIAALLYDRTHDIAFEQHAIDRCRKLVAAALDYRVAGPIDYGLQLAGAADARSDPYVILLHATARPEKEWDEAHWRELGERIAASGERVILPWGTERERARSERLAKTIPGGAVPDRRPLDAMAKLIGGAHAVVGVDTGLLHLATALGRPTVAVYSASDPALNGPAGVGPIAVCGCAQGAPSVRAVWEAFVKLRAPV